MSLREVLAYNRFSSSTNWFSFEFFIDRIKSFIYIYIYIYMRNNKGPKIEPCGTPYLIVWTSYLSLLVVAYWVLSLR